MLNIEQVIELKKSNSSCLDGRDLYRLCNFLPVSRWKEIGFELPPGFTPPTVIEWNKENIIRQMGDDLNFAFKKALNKRGISSSFMYEVIKMWLWILEDELQHSEDYAQYGLPLFKQVAIKYGFPNPIGNDNGSEYKYSSDSDY